MSGSEEILKTLSNQREFIRRFGVRSIGIFGSFARGEQKPESDVDVLVELDNKSFDSYMDLLFFLEDLFGRKVDLVDRNTIKPIIRDRVLNETIYVPNF